MKTLFTDLAMCFDLKENQLTRLSGSYVNDTIRAATKDIRNKCHKTHCRFEMSENGKLFCSFSGFHVRNGVDTKPVPETDQLA